MEMSKGVRKPAQLLRPRGSTDKPKEAALLIRGRWTGLLKAKPRREAGMLLLRVKTEKTKTQEIQQLAPHGSAFRQPREKLRDNRGHMSRNGS